MSDTDRPATEEAAPVRPRNPNGIYEHYCENPGCKKWGGWGFAVGKNPPHWFCYEHRAEGERYRG